VAAVHSDPENAALSATAVERETPELTRVSEWEDRQLGITLEGRG